MRTGFVGVCCCLLFVSSVSCLDVAEGRAKRDLEIGHGQADGLRVDVNEGLAAIRTFNADEIGLWASAPTLSIKLTTGEKSKSGLRLRLENTLKDASLSAKTKDGTPVVVTLVESPHPTEHVFRFDAPANETLTLTLSAPDEADLSPFRVAMYADVQEALPKVQDIYRKMNDTPGIRFALISGDLTSRGSPEELELFQHEMKSLEFPCFSTLGNHELGTRDDLYQFYFGRANSSFEFRGVRFSLIDSASATVDPLVREWLDEWLRLGQDNLHIATMHLPPLDPVGSRNGAFANRAEADDLLSALAAGHVDLTVYGHIHSYYLFENAGIPAHITGGGGASPERLDGVGRHFLTIDLRPPNTLVNVAVVRVD